MYVSLQVCLRGEWWVVIMLKHMYEFRISEMWVSMRGEG